MDNDPGKNALYFVALMDLGLAKVDEIIEWADDYISKVEKPTYEMIELSVSDRNDIKSVRDRLGNLSRESDIFITVEAIMPRILEEALRDRLFVRRAARWFYSIAVSKNYNLPSKFRFFCSADDDFELADDGVFSFEEVYARFVANISAACEAPRIKR